MLCYSSFARSAARAIGAVGAALLMLALPLPSWARVDGYSTYEPATVDLPIARPPTRSCVVTLFHDRAFAGTPDVSVPYAPPAGCTGPWSKVVLTLDTRVKGRQYDRVGAIAFDRFELLRFSTAEPTNAGFRYSIETDVTRYSPVLRRRRTVLTELGNVVNATYTGVYFLSATLRFYTTSPAVAAAPVADVIEPFAAPPGTSSTAPGFRATYAGLPKNIVHAVLDLAVSNHGCDEFWYSNQPDGYVRAHPHHDLCGGGPYREIDLFVDGHPASVVYPFPYIWTGGVNPMLWRPLSALHSLAVPPYAVDLDPFAGVLSDGAAHTIAARVFNDRGSWFIAGSLMLWTDRHAARTSGALTLDTIVPGVHTTAFVRRSPHADRFSLTARSAWRVGGYVVTSRGRVWHRIDNSMRFSNAQVVDLGSGRGDAQGTTVFVRRTTTTERGRAHVRVETTAYPLVVNATYPPRGSRPGYDFVVSAEVHQALIRGGTDGRCVAKVDATATYQRRTTGSRDVARGRTVESNACRGTSGTFAIERAAENGRLIPFPRGSHP